MMGRDWDRRPTVPQLLGIAEVQRAKKKREGEIWKNETVRYLIPNFPTSRCPSVRPCIRLSASSTLIGSRVT